MDRLTLIAFLRGLARHKLNAALTIGGLAVGIAVFLILGLYVRFETGYETWLPHYRQIHLIDTRLDGDIDSSPNRATPIAVWSAIHRDLPDVTGTRIVPMAATVVHDGTGASEPFAYVDPDFAKVFDLPMVEGDLLHAFDNPSNAVITRAVAQRYFPAGHAIGQTITVVFRGDRHIYRVAGVLRDLPENTGLKIGILARTVIPEDHASPSDDQTHHWNYFQGATYVLLPDPASATAFASRMDGVIERHARAETPDNPQMTMHTRIQPIADVFFETPGTALAVRTLGIVGALTLLIAAVNYVNLATARAGLRAREVAMRKVLGASRAVLARQYIGEAVATTAIATLFGLALAEAGLASFNTARRIKEIGIRKTLGASSSDIVKLLVGQFLRPVLIANLFAWPLAFLAMRTWLVVFDDRIALSPLYFVGATAVALGIASLTVLAQSLRAARAVPAWALRHE